jgi:polyisoprenoid-binding protein YceI
MKMKNVNKSIAALFIVMTLIVPVLAQAGSWDIDPAHTLVGFKIRHMMVTNVRGSFHDVKGTLQFDATAPGKSSVDVVIQAASIDTRIEKRDNHLRSPDFFDVEKFPTLTFKSTKFEKLADGVFKVTGNLTIHGVTREVVLDVEGLDQQVVDPWGGTRMGAFATTMLNRKDYGLTWNKALEAGGWLVGDEVTVNLELEVVEKK